MSLFDIENIRLGGYIGSTLVRDKYMNTCKDILTGNISSTSSLAEQPSKIKLKLWKHQLSMLNAMEELEKDKYKYTEKVDMGVLSNKVGSGKSAIILSLIANKPVIKNKKKLLTRFNRLDTDVNSTSTIENSVLYNPTYTIKSNLLVVPHSIYTQWMSYIKDITTLSVYGIDRRKKIFSDYSEYSKYDIVLCKSTMYNDLVSSYIDTDNIATNLTNPEITRLTESMNMESVLDQLTTIHNTSVAGPTSRYGMSYMVKGLKKYKSNVVKFKKQIDKLNRLIQGIDIQSLEDCFKCGDGYHIEKYSEVRDVIWSRVIIDEADSIKISQCYRADAHMTWLISSNLHNLLLNQGAYDRTTGRVVVERISGYTFLGEIITENFNSSNSDNIPYFTLKCPDDFIEDSLRELIPPYEISKVLCFTPPELRVLSGVVSKEIIQMINAGDVESATTALGCRLDTKENLLKNFTERLQNRLDGRKQRERQIKRRFDNNNFRDEDHMVEISEERVEVNVEIAQLETQLNSITEKITNAENEVCPICYDNTSNPTIVPCCKNIYCFECIMSWNATKQTCPLCRETLISADFNVMGDKKAEIETDLKTKMEELEILIKEKTGDKVLIFSEFDNSFRDVRIFLTEEEINYNKLAGSSGKIKNIVKDYSNSEDKQVLLLNAKQFGSGLNLEMTTDIIFFHRMSVDMEKQVIGRGQRVGRTCPLKVHYLCYENEMN